MKDYLILNPALDSLSNEHTLALFVGKGQEHFVDGFLSHFTECVLRTKGLEGNIQPLALEYPPPGSHVIDFELFFDSPFSASRLAAFEGLFFIDLSAYAGYENSRELRMLRDYIAAEKDITFVIAMAGTERSAALKVFEAVSRGQTAELVTVDTVSLKADLGIRKGVLTAEDEDLIDSLSGMIADRGAVESIISAVMGSAGREVSR